MDVIGRLYTSLIDAVVSPHNVGAQLEVVVKTILQPSNQVGGLGSGVKRDISDIVAFHAGV